MLCAATAVFADVFPIYPQPELFVNHVALDAVSLTGSVYAITDNGNCLSGCDVQAVLYADNSGLFKIFHDSTILLQGTIAGVGILPGGEAGVLFDITFDNVSAWSSIEGQPAGSFGPQVAFNVHKFLIGGDGSGSGSGSGDNSGDDSGDDGGDNHKGDDHSGMPYGELGPSISTAAPEPASLTLVIGGIAAGLLRKKYSK